MKETTTMTTDQIEIQQTIKRNALIVRCEDRLQAARDFADRVKLRASLEECLERLQGPYFSRETRTTLYTDFAPHSFGFDKEFLHEDGTWHLAYNGGLIYHGPHDNGGDGGGPTFSVSLTPHNGWSIHT
jgi:hypothetical protein